MQNIIYQLTHIEQFVRYETEHLIWLAFTVLYLVFWIWLGKKQASNAAQQGVAYIFSFISIIAWLLMTYIHICHDPLYQSPCEKYPDGYSVMTVYPLHLCYMLNLLLPLMHLFRSHRLFDTWYPWVMAACLQALFTADLDEAFPHYYNLRYFIVHATLVLHVLYAAIIYKFRLDYWTPVRSLLIGTSYFFALHFVNIKMKTNFMYTEQTPPGTVLELLQPNWFWKAEGILIILFYIVCAPLYLKRKAGNNA
jgi:hypothetical integral membrane protein (TIGR02206 family)